MDLAESQKKPTIKVEIDFEPESKNEAEQPKGAENISLKAVENNSSFNAMLRSSSPKLPASGQLTMFYNGSVSVYDAVTPEKAQAIMLIAAAASAVSHASANKGPIAAGPKSSPTAAAALMRSLSQHSSSGATAATAAVPQPQVLANPSANSLCKLQADVPIARRQSLQQFLEKRRNRLVSKAPYVVAKKPEEGMEVKPQI